MPSTEYKINDVVFVVDQDEITKTKVIGVKDVLEKKYSDGGQEVRYYLVNLKKGSYGGQQEDWFRAVDKETEKPNLYKTLDEAKSVISDRVQAEIIDRLSKVTITDVSGD